MERSIQPRGSHRLKKYDGFGSAPRLPAGKSAVTKHGAAVDRKTGFLNVETGIGSGLQWWREQL